MEQRNKLKGICQETLKEYWVVKGVNIRIPIAVKKTSEVGIASRLRIISDTVDFAPYYTLGISYGILNGA